MLVGVDVGGTFTDAVLLDAAGEVYSAKVATTPQDQALGVLEAVGAVLAGAGATASSVERFAHGMTVATNALLEGSYARTALIATAGFTDVIELGRQARASLYRLCAAAPQPLVEAELRFGARERCGPNGPLLALSDRHARGLVRAVAAAEPRAVAVSLLHSYAYPQHEQALAGLLRERLGAQAHVSLSSELVGTFREYERTATTVLDAALSPVVGSYLRRLAQECRARGLREPQIMQSSGGLTSIERAAEHAAVTVLSGPAGGVTGAGLLASLAGVPDVLCLDMGGTSCDACVISQGAAGETAERAIAGRPLALPALDIETVGAGGGSIGWRDAGGALRVGPQSAGAVPGPACYGRGGERPTVTDANLLLGRLPADGLLAGGVRLDREAAERAVAGLARELGLAIGECAAGIVRVAEAEMLRALRRITVERGVDPRRFTLMAFGGAGPLHCCALAQELGIAEIICPGAAGVLCALGLAAGSPRRDVARTVMLRGATLTDQRIAEARDELLGRARLELGARESRARTVYELRYRGQSFELPVETDSSDPGLVREAFARLHEERYGYRDDGAEVELVTIRASVWEAAPRARLHRLGAAGGRLLGPTTYALAQATVWVAEGWAGTVDEWGNVRLRRVAGDLIERPMSRSDATAGT
ncbi:MAG TPA: hydantoinase/oxoprolinase family protein [Solirubrobacteraceae bacterium]|nr:hydantoinase/oxoprolinase family protein [Solirubrobacteraceae bacterium]